MEENQDLNNVVVDNTVPAAEPVPTEVPVTPVVEAAPVEAAPVEVPVEQPVEVPVEATPVVEQAPVEVPVEATPVTPVVEEVAPVVEATPVPETPVAEAAPVEAAPVEVPVETPAPEVAPVEAAPVEGPVVEVVQETPAIGEAAPELPVVEPAPAVNEMPETPTDAPAVEAVVTPEAPVEGAAPVEEKKSKTGLILIVILLLVAVGAAVYFFLIKGKDEPAPKPVENNTVVERAAKYFKDGNNELTLYSDDNTFVFVLADSTFTGTYTATSTEITLNGVKEYRTDGCSDVTGLIITLQVNEDGTFAGTEGIVSGTKFSEVSKSDVAAFTETDCVVPATPEENTTPTTPEENTTTEEPATVAVEKVELDATEKTLKVKETFTLVATVTPEDATNKAVEWSSANNKIAKVDKNGKVTAVKAGTVKITVKTKDGGKKATCSVTVEAEETAAENTTSDETALNKPNCTYDVTKVNTEGSSQYNKLKNALNTKGQNAGTTSAQGCKPLSEIIADVKAAVKEEAEKCWKDEYVTKAVESAECKLTPGCDKTSKYGSEAIFEEGKKNSIISIWTNPTWNCAKTEADYKL